MKTQLVGIAVILFGIAIIISGIGFNLAWSSSNSTNIIGAGVTVALIGLGVTVIGAIRRDRK